MSRRERSGRNGRGYDKNLLALFGLLRPTVNHVNGSTPPYSGNHSREDVVRRARLHEATRTPEQRSALQTAGDIYRSHGDNQVPSESKRSAGELIRIANSDVK